MKNDIIQKICNFKLNGGGEIWSNSNFPYIQSAVNCYNGTSFSEQFFINKNNQLDGEHLDYQKTF